MEQSDVEYLSQGISEMFGELSTMLYVPVKDGEVNRYGDKVSVYDVDNSFTVYGVLSTEVSKERDLDRKDSQSSHRLDGTIKLVTKTFTDRGKRIKLGDSIDVLNEYGEFERYLITGFDKKVEMPFIITRLFVTKLERMAGE